MNGFLVDPGDEDRLVQLTGEILGDPSDAYRIRCNAVTTAHSLYPQRAASHMLDNLLPQTA